MQEFHLLYSYASASFQACKYGFSHFFSYGISRSDDRTARRIHVYIIFRPETDSVVYRTFSVVRVDDKLLKADYGLLFILMIRTVFYIHIKLFYRAFEPHEILFTVHNS